MLRVYTLQREYGKWFDRWIWPAFAFRTLYIQYHTHLYVEHYRPQLQTIRSIRKIATCLLNVSLAQTTRTFSGHLSTFRDRDPFRGLAILQVLYYIP